MNLNAILKSEENARAAFMAVLEENRKTLTDLFDKSGFSKGTYEPNPGESAGKFFFALDDNTAYQERTPGGGDFTFEVMTFDEAGNGAGQRALETLNDGGFWTAADYIFQAIQRAIETLEINQQPKIKLIEKTRAIFEVKPPQTCPAPSCKCEGGEPKAKTPPRRKPAAKRRKRPAKKEKALFSNMVIADAEDLRGEAAAFPLEPARKQAKPEAAFISDRTDTN